mmetsp:Transcript_10055/g.40617  ORF Transcript_10055/g.40617 Transcript_10055/m.40617 type:complete len:239 (+) Transcript_10055:481-1197(+)
MLGSTIVTSTSSSGNVSLTNLSNPRAWGALSSHMRTLRNELPARRIIRPSSPHLYVNVSLPPELNTASSTCTPNSARIAITRGASFARRPVIMTLRTLGSCASRAKSGMAGPGSHVRGGSRDSALPHQPLCGHGWPVSRSYCALPVSGTGVLTNVPSKSQTCSSLVSSEELIVAPIDDVDVVQNLAWTPGSEKTSAKCRACSRTWSSCVSARRKRKVTFPGSASSLCVSYSRLTLART